MHDTIVDHDMMALSSLNIETLADEIGVALIIHLCKQCKDPWSKTEARYVIK